MKNKQIREKIYRKNIEKSKIDILKKTIEELSELIPEVALCLSFDEETCSSSRPREKRPWASTATLSRMGSV